MRYSVSLINQKVEKHYDKPVFLICTGVLIICLVLNFLKLTEFKKSHTNLIPIGSNLVNLEAEISATNKLLSIHQFDWSKFLARLEKIVPEKMSIESITPTFNEDMVYIAGFCATEEELVTLIKNLQNNTWASEAFLAEQHVIESTNESIISFSVSFKYKGL